MSKVYADAVTATEANQDLTLGGSGDNVIVTAGATLKTNTVKDSGGNTLWTSDGSGNLSSINSGLKGNMTLLTTNTASNAASSSFTSLIDSTYKLYIFKFIDVNPATNNAELTFQVNTVGASGYNETITSTSFHANHYEDNSTQRLSYDSDKDQAQGTAYNVIGGDLGNEADECAAGELFLFNPSNTTNVTHWHSTVQLYRGSDITEIHYSAGYINVTAAIDEIDFKMSSGNIDSVIKMYGVG